MEESPYNGYFDSAENCRNDLMLARKAMQSKQTTAAEWDQMEKTLALMYLHCPDDMQTTVYAALNEAVARRTHLELLNKALH